MKQLTSSFFILFSVRIFLGKIISGYNNKLLGIKFFIICLLSLFLSQTSCFRDDTELKVFFIRSGNVYSMDENGGDVRLLLSGGTYNYPTSSADGEFLLCREGSVSVIYSLKNLSLYRSFLTASPYTHSWSPDGRMIAATDGPGTTKVFNVATGNQIWTSGGGGKTGHYFTNNSLFIIESSGLTLNEYLPAVDVIPERTRAMPLGFSGLTLSPDGRYILASQGGNIYIMIENNLSSYWMVRSGSQPSWSPDNETIIFNDGGNIATCDIYGGNYRQLTSSGTDSYPCFQYKPK